MEIIPINDVRRELLRMLMFLTFSQRDVNIKVLIYSLVVMCNSPKTIDSQFTSPIASLSHLTALSV
jgi:hypothetical protein